MTSEVLECSRRVLWEGFGGFCGWTRGVDGEKITPTIMRETQLFSSSTKIYPEVMYALYAREWYCITRNIQKTLRTSQPRAQEVSEISGSTFQAQESLQTPAVEEGSTIKELREKLEASQAEERRLEKEIEEMKRHLANLKVQKPQEKEEQVPEDEDFELVSSKDC